VEELLDSFRIRRIEISAYHPQSNGLVERGHAPIVNALSKYCHENKKAWFQYLTLALWADRISVRRPTGYSAFRLLYGRECILPVELAISSWSAVEWEDVRSREDLLAARIKQLDERSLEESRAAERLERSRLGNKRYFDKHKRLRSAKQQLRVGDLVLLHNTSIETSHNVKLEDQWRGPYKIREVSETGFYRLEELDGTHLKESFAGNRLKRFFSRSELERGNDATRGKVGSRRRGDENDPDDLDTEGEDDGSDPDDGC